MVNKFDLVLHEFPRMRYRPRAKTESGGHEMQSARLTSKQLLLKEMLSATAASCLQGRATGTRLAVASVRGGEGGRGC